MLLDVLKFVIGRLYIVFYKIWMYLLISKFLYKEKFEFLMLNDFI